jgi:drug/metabolite transporter (DMT)-like permease
MEHLWIPIAITSAICQTVRTAAQKSLNQHLSTLVTTYVRFLFGLPLLVIYVAAVMLVTGESVPELNSRFWMHTALSSFAQFFGNALLVYLLTLRNFAVGTMLMKADLLFTAAIGSLLFSETITGAGWLAISLTLLGVLLISTARTRGDFRLSERSTLIGLGVALLFALSYLALREATLDLRPSSATTRAAWAAVCSTGLQVIVVGIWLVLREPAGIRAIAGHLPLALFSGSISALGTITWFLASALQNASYVAAVAQVQVVFSLLISWLWFKERILALELVGIAVILAGVLLFRL